MRWGWQRCSMYQCPLTNTPWQKSVDVIKFIIIVLYCKCKRIVYLQSYYITIHLWVLNLVFNVPQ